MNTRAIATNKQLLAAVTKEFAKPRLAMSVRLGKPKKVTAVKPEGSHSSRESD